MKKTVKSKAILFSDLHASTKRLTNLYDIVIQNNEIGLIVCAGDVVNMGEPVWFIDKLIKVIDDIGLPFVWVPGNNDFGRSYHKLNSKYKSVEGRIAEEAGLSFTGVGGSPASWAGQYAGESMVDRKKIGGTIFISHYPPPGILTLQQKDLPTPLLESRNQEVVGLGCAEPRRKSRKSGSKVNENCHSELDSESIYQNGDEAPKQVRGDSYSNRRFADSPLIHICGHLHYRWGTAYLGQTKVVQLASLETGHYAIMDLNDLSIEFKEIK